MNQQWQAPSSEAGGGSVRRARERVEGGLPPEIPSPPRQNPYVQPRAMPQANRSRPQMPPALAGTRNGQGPIGVAISRPTQVPQWPLAATIEGTSEQQYQPPAGRGAAPQRPPRPSHVPSMLDASRLQDHTPTFQYKSHNAQGGSMPPDEVTSPVMSMSSRPSTISSVGTIPDFPVPMPPPVMPGPPGPGPPGSGPPRRSANLGPPPTSRRGNSSYYSQASYVSPIPEESPRTQPSHESYASSAAIPTSWGSDSPGFRFEDDDEYEDDYRDSRDARQWRNEPIEEGRESRESNNDDDDRGLIRSASLGKRAKPSMITTKSSDTTRPSPMPQQVSKLERMGVLASVSGAPASGLTASRTREGQRETVWPMIGNPDSPLASGTGFIDKSSSNSEESVPQVARAITTDEPAPNNTTTSNPSADAMLGAYNAASGLAPSVTPSRTPSPGFSRLSAVRRPPRLDMDAVRDAEARGSLTSLPDLIRRATRLAAMMDRGKRPASRLNDLNDFGDFPTASQLEKEKELEGSPNGKRQSGLSGMLSAFPPPGLGTPRDGTPNRPNSAWPSPYDDDTLNPGSPPRQQPPKRRRCCGLPVWAFLLVPLILLIIIAAAVVVPLELLVLHKPKTSSTSTASALSTCSSTTATACQNGGTSILDNGSCSCICINGFTGPTCTVANLTGCTTTTFPSGTYSNVTLGNAIVRLISGAQANFSIPLFESVILARFSAANLTCASENALVTFDGNSQRVGSAADTALATSATPAATSTSVAGSGEKVRRSPYQSSYASTSAPTAAAPSTTASSTSASPTASIIPNADFTVTQQVLDFARVAVLFVLQQEDIDNAVTAQGQLQHAFSLNDLSNKVARNVSIGAGNTVDLLTFTINLGNGTQWGSNGSVTRRAILGRSANLWSFL